MKKNLLVMALLVATTFTAFANNDKPITVEQLPSAAQNFISKHFAGTQVSFAKMENEMLTKSYDVVFTDGSKVEFDSKGKWTEVDCVNRAVPTEIVPQKIRDYVSANHSGAKITEISRSSRDHEIKLSNGLELKFNSKYKLVEIDR